MATWVFWRFYINIYNIYLLLGIIKGPNRVSGWWEDYSFSCEENGFRVFRNFSSQLCVAVTVFMQLFDWGRPCIFAQSKNLMLKWPANLGYHGQIVKSLFGGARLLHVNVILVWNVPMQDSDIHTILQVRLCSVYLQKIG